MNTSKHHGKIREISVFAALLFLCVGVQSCKDPYLLDDEEPDWLGASIYDYMQEKGNFTYFLKVIDDLNYTEVLSKTGSKTLFAADDEAFMKGIKDAWGLTSYSQLSDAQKKVILYNSMLDNAYLLEMMSSSAASGTDAEVQEGRCLRQVTSANIVDTIGHYAGNELPQNNPFWDRYREKGIRLALDGTNFLMVHFLEEQLYQNNITLNDLEILFNHRYGGKITADDAFIFDKRVINQNVTCKNGYVHQLDGLLIPPSNMAEEIRRNPKTKLFSRLLDRFAVPVYNAQLSSDYNRLYHYGDDANAERVYEKRYFTSTRNRNATGDYLDFMDDDQRTRAAKGSLYFDPGWNSFTSGVGGSVEADMGAMFVPNDETLEEYFRTGKGKALIERYGIRADGNRISIADRKGLEEAVDSIPMDVIQALLRNVMKSTFNATVPSKFESIMNDARESMKIEVAHIDECMITNNGVVYVTKEVYSPARYVAVIAPVMLGETTQAAYWAINSYEYDKYLLAMDSYFSLIVPSEGAMRYNDVSSLRNPNPTCYIFHYEPPVGSKKASVYAEQWTYDKATGELLEQSANLTNSGRIKNLLEQMMEYYIIVGDFEDGNKYHMAKGYGTVKVEYGSQTRTRVRNGVTEEVPVVDRVYGGHEIEIDTTGVDTGLPIGEMYIQENGVTYRLDAGMIQPPTQSVYKVLSDPVRHEDFNEFFQLCQTSDAVVELVGARNDKGQIDPDSTKKFLIFENANGLDYNIHTFNTYHYTVYVPTNDAILDACERGLPTWDVLEEEAEEVNDEIATVADLETQIEELQNALALKISNNEPDTAVVRKQIDDLQATVDQKNAQITTRKKDIEKRAMLIIDFVKYHIQDNSVYVDEKPHQMVEGNNVYTVVNYETASLDNLTKRFSKVSVETKESPYSTHPTISVKGDIDEIDNTCYVINSGKEGQDYNIMTRDIEFASSNALVNIETSSYAVVHQIDNYLVNDRIFKNGRFTTENE
ncbi:MAG: hypothetical protein IKP91_10025 [Bacteroidaceae bacterium]|nr:hypothetical protein [Bacteroidaceae bacterium]